MVEYPEAKEIGRIEFTDLVVGVNVYGGNVQSFGRNTRNLVGSGHCAAQD
jgi:hypothetical protein